MSCEDYPTAQTAKTFKLDAETVNEVVTLEQDRTNEASDSKTKKTLWGIETDATNQRDEFEQLASDQRDNFEISFSSQFNFKRIGNISDYAGQSLPEADKLNSYQYPDDSGDWYVPEQGQSFPITIPADPAVAGSNWYLQSPSGVYRGLWPDTGGNADKGDTYQTQVSGTPTGQYFTALQNTAVDPIGDDVNWREVISPESLSQYTDRVYKASGGNSSFENMIAGIPIAANVGDTCKCEFGGEFVRVSSVGDITDFEPVNMISFLNFGAVGGAFDNDAAVQKMIDHLKANDGGAILVPYHKDGFGIVNSVFLPSNTTLVMHGEFVGNGIMSPYELMLSPESGAENVTVITPRLNCNNQPALSGIMPRLGCDGFTSIGGYVKNASHDQTRGGGRCVSVHGGTTANPNKNVSITQIRMFDSYQAADISSDDDDGNENVYIEGIAENCEVVAASFTAKQSSFPLSPEVLSGTIKVQAKNCGVSSTYVRNGALICSNGGGNVDIDVSCTNDAAYTAAKAPNIVMGKWCNSNIKVNYRGSFSFAVNNQKWSEQDAQFNDDLVSINNTIDVVINGIGVSPYFSPRLETGGGVSNTRSKVNVSADGFTQSTIAPASEVDSDIFINFSRKDTATSISGYLSKLMIDSINWSSFVGRALSYQTQVGYRSINEQVVVRSNTGGASYILESATAGLNVSANNMDIVEFRPSGIVVTDSVTDGKVAISVANGVVTVTPV